MMNKNLNEMRESNNRAKKRLEKDEIYEPFFELVNELDKKKKNSNITKNWLKKNNFDKVGVFISKPDNSSGIGVEFIDPKFVNSATDWIYCLVLNDEIKYVGETAQTLAQRIRLYYLEARTDSTNAMMRQRLKELIANGKELVIYAQKAPIIHYNNRDIKLRVDLEISIIKELRPEWNKKGLYKKDS